MEASRMGVMNMQELIERIKKDGKIKPGNVLKVDSFLNHQIDPKLGFAMAQEIKRLYADETINKVLTIEASGIALAVMTGYLFECPVVFAKKSNSSNVSDELYTAAVHSYTHGTDHTVIVSKSYLNPDDRVLIVDDFLANGAALEGLKSIVEQSGAAVVGAAIAVEKAFQSGGARLRAEGMRIESLAKIASMSDDSITFCEE